MPRGLYQAVAGQQIGGGMAIGGSHDPTRILPAFQGAGGAPWVGLPGPATAAGHGFVVQPSVTQKASGSTRGMGRHPLGASPLHAHFALPPSGVKGALRRPLGAMRLGGRP